MQRLLLLTSRQLLLLGATVAFSATVHAQSTMSPEETAVRTAYARLAFATETNALVNVTFHLRDAATLDADLAKGQLHVSLSTFKVGPLSDFGGRLKFADLADSPQTPIIVVPYKPQRQSAEGMVDQLSAKAVWSSTVPPHAGVLLPQTIYASYGDRAVKDFSRYATYVATVTLDGQVRSARATVLFDQQGRIAVVDELIGSPLIPFFSESVYPHILMETRARQVPVVANWLSHQVVAAPSCPADQQHDCYDSTTGKVGFHPDNLQRSLTNPPALKTIPKAAIDGARPADVLLPAPTVPPILSGASNCSAYSFNTVPHSFNISNNAEHSSGSHFFYGATTGSCLYNDVGAGGFCNVTAIAEIYPRQLRTAKRG